METYRQDQLSLLGQSIATGFLLLTSYYTFALGVAHAHNSTLWTVLLALLFVGTSALLVLSFLELVSGHQGSKSLVMMGALLMLLQILAVAAVVIADTI